MQSSSNLFSLIPRLPLNEKEISLKLKLIPQICTFWIKYNCIAIINKERCDTKRRCALGEPTSPGSYWGRNKYYYPNHPFCNTSLFTGFTSGIWMPLMIDGVLQLLLSGQTPKAPESRLAEWEQEMW